MHTNIIRKLSPHECLYDNETFHKNLNLTRVFLCQLTTGEVTLDLLKRAAIFWVRRHPLLAAEIKRNSENQLDRYFVKRNDATVFQFDNIQLLDETDSLKWMDVMNSEILTKFDMDRDPLWLIKCVRLNSSTSSDYNLALIFTTQHSIADGRCCYEIGVQYLNIIAALIENKHCDEMDPDVVEHSLLTNAELLASKQIKSGLPDIEQDQRNRHPKAFGIQNTTTEDSAVHSGKLECFYFEADELKKILAKVKSSSKSSKLTSVLSTVFCLAFKTLYKRYAVDDLASQIKFQYFQLASIREKIGISNTQMGVYSAVYHGVINVSESDYSEIVNDGNFKPFWSMADEASVKLAESLKRNDEIVFYDEIVPLMGALNDGSYDETNLNFVMSNIGVMRNTSSQALRIKQHYLRMAAIKNRLGAGPFIGVTSIDEKLCIAISYNEEDTRTEVVKEIVVEFRKIVAQLLAS